MTEEILDDCLDALLGGEPLERCLARYPEHAEELEPLLRMALEAIKAPWGEPSPGLKLETRRLLHLSVRESRSEGALEDALSDCIDLLIQGRSLEGCLAHHPQFSQALRPLLETAWDLRQCFAVEARPGFKMQALKRVMASRSRGRRRVLGWELPAWPRWVYRGAAAAAVVLVVSLAGMGAVRASSDSMPDDLLYPVKEITEKVQLSMPQSNSDEAKLRVKLANRRAHEMAEMARQGNYVKVESLMHELEEHLEMVPFLIQQQQKDAAIKMVFQEKGGNQSQGLKLDEVRALLVTLDRDMRLNVADFKKAVESAPPGMRGELKVHLQETKEYYTKAIVALEFSRSTVRLNSLEGVGLAFNK